MAHRFIADLSPGDRIDGAVYLIKSKDLRTTTQGGLYIHAVLMDRTGQMLARMWQATEEIYAEIRDGGFLTLKGRVESYKGNPQFIIDALQPAPPGSYETGDYLPTTTRDVDRMWSRVREIIEGIKHPELAALMRAFLEDEALMERFRRAPAAAAMHHAFVGGLLEHTAHVLELAMRTIPLYPKLSLDLVLAGVFMHDLAKTHELRYDTAIQYTDDGQLLGHITIGVMWIEKKAEEAAQCLGRPIPDELKWVLQHLVLSHHGQHEYGSPKLPALPEAAAIHYLDNLDAKITMFLAAIDNDRDAESHWTSFQPALQSRVYKLDVTGVRDGEPSSE